MSFDDINVSIVMDVLGNRVLEFLCVYAYGLEWVALETLASAIGLDDDYSNFSPWEVHLHPRLEEVVHILRTFDGEKGLYDLRINFVGMEDAVRLRRDVTTSITSIPALAWKERVYEFIVDYIQRNSASFGEECGMNISEIVKIPEMARPPSLKLARLAAQGGRRKVHEVSEAELLRQILMQDHRFELKFHVQQDLHRRRATERADRYNKQRVTVLKRHHTQKDYSRSDFENEYAVFLAADPVYILRYAAISGRVGDSFSKSTGGDLGTVDDASICGCSAIIYKKNIARFTRDDLAECTETEVWRFRDTVGNHALRQVGEYRALLAGLRVCADKGLFPLSVQGWSDQVNNHAVAMIYEEPDLSKLGYSERKRYQKPEPAYQSHLCIPLFKEAKSLCDLIIETAREEHYYTPKEYNIIGLPDSRKTSERVWKVSWAASDFKECGNGVQRPACKVVPLATAGGGGNEEKKEEDVRVENAVDDSMSAWKGRVPGTNLALSMTEPLLPPITFKRIHVQEPLYQETLVESDKARTEGFMKDRGWSSKSYVARDEDWTVGLKYGR